MEILIIVLSVSLIYVSFKNINLYQQIKTQISINTDLVRKNVALEQNTIRLDLDIKMLKNEIDRLNRLLKEEQQKPKKTSVTVNDNDEHNIITKALKSYTANNHPDKGGTTEEFQKIKAVWDKYRNSKPKKEEQKQQYYNPFDAFSTNARTENYNPFSGFGFGNTNNCWNGGFPRW